VWAAFRLPPIKWLSLLGETYAMVIRGIRDLVLILLIFSGTQNMGRRPAPMLSYDD
jgi:arginine/ornithine transport system permease protein